VLGSEFVGVVVLLVVSLLEAAEGGSGTFSPPLPRGDPESNRVCSPVFKPGPTVETEPRFASSPGFRLPLLRWRNRALSFERLGVEMAGVSLDSESPPSPSHLSLGCLGSIL
jgi:hypothetical protein